MKPAQQKKGATEKKPSSTVTPLMGAAATRPVAGKTEAGSVFGSPAEAVWTRYIDSRMKQFGTR